MNKIWLFILPFFLVASEYPILEGILLTNDRLDTSGKKGVHVQGLDLENRGLEKRLQSFLGDPLTERTISCVKKEVMEFADDECGSLLTVFAPEQDLSDGILTLIVIESKAGNVCIRGNCHFPTERFSDAITLAPDCPIRRKRLVKEVQWLNKNPFRSVDIVYSPGEKFGTTDVEIVVNDRRRVRFYGGVDNTGNDTTGNNRFFAGFNWGDVFGLDQIFSYQFTTSDEYHRFWAHTATYTIPLPWYNTLSFYGGYSHVDAKYTSLDIPNRVFSNSGSQWQVSARYEIPLPLFTFALHEVILGYDFKRTNSNLFFGAQPVNPNPTSVNLGQFMAAYNIGYEGSKIYTSWEIEGFCSPGQWYPDQSNSDYAELRVGAKNTYFYARSSFSLLWDLYKPLNFFTALRGQVSSRNLLPSEQFGVGGFNTVRGYREREVNGDDAFLVNLELQTKPFGMCGDFRRRGSNGLILLGFFDYGLAVKNTTAFNQPKYSHLYSMGPGAKYQWFPYIQLKAYWGFQMSRLSYLGGPTQRLHFQCIGSF